MKYVKKRVVIEAVQFKDTKESLAEVMTFVKADITSIMDGIPIIQTLEGNMKVSPGDWVIKGVAGEFYPCKTDIFDLTYEAV